MTTRALVMIAALTAILLPQPFGAQFSLSQSKSIDFAAASPKSQGISEESLRLLDSVVRGHVERDEIIGAELLVIKNRRMVLHEAFRWRDREKNSDGAEHDLHRAIHNQIPDRDGRPDAHRRRPSSE